MQRLSLYSALTTVIAFVLWRRLTYFVSFTRMTVKQIVVNPHTLWITSKMVVELS
jgi:hypothetical protein